MGVRFRDVRALSIGGVSKDDILRCLAQNAIKLNDYARDLFADPEFKTSSEARDVRLALVSLPEIGLPNGGRFDDILSQASNVGLEPCPLEVAPHLRLSYLGQILGPYLTVASSVFRSDPLAPNGFYLRRHEDGLWLRGYNADYDHVYAPDFTDFVFMCSER